MAKKYAELAQEVKNLGKASQSQGTLSNDEYSEFLEISNQLADLFPRLTVGYDDNGNAILNLNGSVKTITKSILKQLRLFLNNNYRVIVIKGYYPIFYDFSVI